VQPRISHNKITFFIHRKAALSSWLQHVTLECLYHIEEYDGKFDESLRKTACWPRGTRLRGVGPRTSICIAVQVISKDEIAIPWA